jgi:uncharacterized membrane protein YeaQ/YmgE (transglycosylase-associated protein family)
VEIIYMLVIGLIIGVVAKILMPGKDPGGIFVTSLLGIAGSFVAGFLAPKIGWHPQGGLMRFAASVLGAMLLLFLYRLVAPRASRR